MPSSFSLNLVNPAVGNPPQNVVYTGLSGGNILNLVVANISGFDMTIGGSSTGQYLALSISANVLDAGSAAQLAIGSPWAIASVVPPSGTASLADAGQSASGSILTGFFRLLGSLWRLFFPADKLPEKVGAAAKAAATPGNYVFNLQPPSGGVVIPNNGSITIALSGLNPVAKGAAQVGLQYQFDNDGDDLNLSATLSVLGSVNPALAQLIGAEGALQFSFYVNTGDDANPIMVSASPVTEQNAIENQLQLNLLFQAVTAPGFSPGDDNGNLVEQWNSASPPTFRIYFPYFSVNEGLPAAIDLTDSLSNTDANYNPITSAWNIAASLNAGNPNVNQNGFWQIGLDPQSSQPAWMLQPLASNQHLFTATEGDSSEPGPFLDLFFSHIFSGLPINMNDPETILYFQWNDFPGFNDGLAAFPLQKRNLAINTFTCSIVRKPTGVSLSFIWTTTNASYCTLSGDPSDAHLDANILTSTPYVVPVNANQPIQSQYTLTAVGADGVTQVMRTVKIQWALNQSLPSATVGAGAIQYAPNGAQLLFLDYSGSFSFYNPETLQQLPLGPITFAADNFAITPDSQTVFLTGDSGTAQGYNMINLEPTNGSGFNFSGGSLGPFGSLALSPDGSKYLAGTNQAQVNGQNVGANTLAVLEAAGLKPVAGSPFSLPDSPLNLVTGPQTGNIYIGMQNEVSAYSGTSYTPLSLPSLPLTFPGLMAISNDETALYVISATQVEPFSFILSKINPSTMKVVLQVNIGCGFFPLTEALLGVPMAAMELSVDNSVVFITGLTTQSILNSNSNDPTFTSVFIALNTETLQELSWSPLETGPIFPMGLAMSPDGSRLMALAAFNPTEKNATASIFAFDPLFQ